MATWRCPWPPWWGFLQARDRQSWLCTGKTVEEWEEAAAWGGDKGWRWGKKLLNPAPIQPTGPTTPLGREISCQGAERSLPWHSSP